MLPGGVDVLTLHIISECAHILKGHNSLTNFTDVLIMLVSAQRHSSLQPNALMQADAISYHLFTKCGC